MVGFATTTWCGWYTACSSGKVFYLVGSPFTDIASLLILAPLLTQLLNAQHMINASCGDPDGESNSRFTNANYAWIVFGVLFWILNIWGIVLPG